MKKILVLIAGMIMTINCFCSEPIIMDTSNILETIDKKLPIEAISIKDTLYIKAIENPTNNINSLLSSYTSLLKDILTILVIIIGSFFGVRKLTERLSENHLKEVISTVHESNKQVRNVSIKLKNKYIKLSNNNVRLTTDELKEVYTELSELIEYSGSSSKEIANYCFLLHKTIEGVIRYFNDNNVRYVLTKSELFNIVNFCLSHIIDLSTSVAIVPKKIKTESKKYINGPESKYLNNNSISHYKGLRYGLGFLPSTPIYYKIFEFINYNSTYMFSKAFFEIYRSYYSMLLFIEKNKFYFPPVLEGQKKDLLFGKKQLALIYVSTATTMEENPKKIYQLYYSNLSPMLNFVDSELKEKQIPNDYFDSLIPDSGVNYERIAKIFKCSVETVQLEISEEDVVDLYKRNKKKIRRILLRDKRQMELYGKTYIMKLLLKIRNCIIDPFRLL